MKTKRILFISILLLAVISCSKKEDDISSSSAYSDDIKGVWEWIESGGGFSGKKNTPQEAGYTSNMNITKDSIYIYYDDTLSQKEEYFLTTIYTPFEQEVMRVVYLRDSLNDSIVQFIDFDFLIYQDTLNLQPIGFADAGYSLYIRK